MQRAISLLGLLVMLGLAYLFSKHRSQVKFRTVIWGVALQFLLAVAILSGGTASFVALFTLAFLVVLYLGEEEMQRRFGNPWLVGVGTLAASAAVVAAGYLLTPSGLTTWLLGASIVLFLGAAAVKRPHLGRYGFIGTLLLGVGMLWGRGIDGGVVFRTASDKVAEFLSLSDKGAEFLFANLAHQEYYFPGSDYWPGFGFQFAFSVLPTIIFFSAFMAVLYHLGIVQAVITAMARFMRWSMGTSGAETVSCSANVFIGQTEAPFLVKPFLEQMTISELHAVMVGGFATIAGGVLAGYIRMGVNPGHLIAASVMSAPAALVIAKLLLPETEESLTSGDVELPDLKTADNLVGAAANGVEDGLKLALNVGAMLIAFISLIAMVDWTLGYLDAVIDGRLLGRPFIDAASGYAGYFPANLKTIFGTVLRPLAWVLGVPWADSLVVGNLLGIKLTVNEFVAYGELGRHIANGDLSQRAIIISTYALCGFANFSSIGIQIGGLGAVAPGRRRDLAKIGVRAMFGGALASWTTAAIAGLLL